MMQVMGIVGNEGASAPLSGKADPGSGGDVAERESSGEDTAAGVENSNPYAALTATDAVAAAGVPEDK
jgi:hypothetical protein